MEGKGRSRRRSPHQQWKRRLSSVLAIVLTAVMVLNMPLSIDGLGLHVSNAFASASNADRMDSVWATASNAKYKQGESQDVDIYVIADDNGAVPGNTSSMTLYLKNNTDQMITEGVLTFKGSHIQKEDGVFQDIGAGDEASQVIVSGPGQDAGTAPESGAAADDGAAANEGAAANDGAPQAADVSGNDAAQGTDLAQDTVTSGEGLLYEESFDADEAGEDSDFAEDFEGDEEDSEEEETWKLTGIDLQPGEMHEVSFAFYTDEDVKSTKAHVKFSFAGEDEEGERVSSDTQFYYSIGLPHVNISLEDGMQIESNVNNDMEIWMTEPDWVDEDLEERIEDQEEKEAEKEQEEDADNSGSSDTASDSNASKSDADRADTASDSQADREEKPSVIRDEEKIDKYTDEAMTISESRVSYTVEIFGAEYDLHARKADEVEDIGWISCVYKIAKETQPGIYYGKVTAAGRWNNKKFTSEQGFLFEVTGEWDGNYTAKSENVTVHAHAEDGVLPKNVTLKVTELEEGGAEYNKAKEAMEGTDIQFDGIKALDIRFENQNGEEVEPEGEVQISIEMKEGALPAGATLDTVEVHHLKEVDDETIEVETVADAAGLTDGTVKSGEAVQEELEEIAADAEEETEVSADVYTQAAIPAAAAAPVTLDAVAEVDKDTVAVAEFSVESFSDFTITWGNSSRSQVTVHYVDQQGNEINVAQTIVPDDVLANANEWVNLDSYSVPINGYVYSQAKLGAYNGTSARWIRYRSYGWQYTNNVNDPGENGDAKDWNNGNWQIYLIYTKTDGLTTVPTVDSTAKGVHMYMFNYDRQAFGGGGYGNGETKEGLASTKTNVDGWPTLTNDVDSGYRGKSFKEFFGESDNAYEVDPAYAVNHLFLQENFDKNGEFYYSSAENFATLRNDNDGDFTVYNQLGTPSAEQEYFYQRGNFMPYNTLNTGRVLNHNLYDYEGNKLSTDDERYNENLYGFNQGNDFLFGMYVWADFYQPEGGLVEDNDGSGSSPMIFEFTGDDDMWVYIDGVLVLDLGGIHDAQSGSINFVTGEVKWTDTKTDADPIWKSSDLRTIYTSAGNDMDWKENTFADGTNHRIQIFYMERGEGASNLKMSFNLKTIPDGQLAVLKSVEHYFSSQIKDVEYQMQVKVNGVPYSNQEYTFFQQEDGGTTDAEGKFYLKNNQTAVFPNLTVNDKVSVSEVGIRGVPDNVEIEEAYDISYSVINSSGEIIDDGDGEDGAIDATMPAYGSITVRVTNTAKYTKPIKLIKCFSGTPDNTAPKDFEATYELYEVSGDQKKLVGSVQYSDFTKGEDIDSYYVFWLETGKSYTVEEKFDGDDDSNGGTSDLPWQTYTISDSDDSTSQGDSDGIVELTPNDSSEDHYMDTITITNIYSNNVKILVKKEVEGNMGDRNAPFVFDYSYEKDGATYGEKFSLSDGETKEIEVPYGVDVKITEAVNGYETKYTVVTADGLQLKADDSKECELEDVVKSITVTFTNTRNVQTPTGFTGNSYPYVIMLAIAAVGATSFIYPACRRRRRNGDR